MSDANLPMLTPDAFVARFEPRPIRDVPPPALPLPLRFTYELAQCRVTVAVSDRAMLTASAGGERILVLSGDLVQPQADDAGAALLDLYARRGLDFVADLNGAFCLLLIDRPAEIVAFATDRLNSIKLLASQTDAGLTVSNTLSLQPVRAAAIDRTAVAEILAVNHAYNNRTLYQSVARLDGSSIYRLDDGRLTQRRYWRYAFQTPAAASPEVLRKELGDRLIEVVRRRVRGDRRLFLSLSGGYDSRAVLGLLSQTLGVPDVECFSYAYGDAQPDSDESLAAQLAGIARYRHEPVPAFDGDVLRSLARSAALGGGMTRYCDEVDAWVRLGAQVADGPKPILFTGDMTLMKVDWQLRTVEDVTAAARIRDFSVLSWLEPFLGPAMYRDFLAGTRADIELMLKRAPPDQQGYNLRALLHFENFMSLMIIPWREYFARRFFQPAYPLLDNAVLDFELRLPADLRRGKRLFIETLTAMFPHLFALPHAGSAGYAGYWSDALNRQNAELRASLREQSSPLDDVIPPDILLALLNADRSALTRHNTALRSALKRAYALLRHIHLHRSPLGQPSRFTPAVSADQFLKRALNLRAFLSHMETHAAHTG